MPASLQMTAGHMGAIAGHPIQNPAAWSPYVVAEYDVDAAVAAVPASTAVSVKATASKSTVKGKTVYSVTVVIANASGKSAAISITGLKKVTEKISVANQAFKYTVTAGAKTVSVVISGKTYTTKLTAK